MRTRQLTARLSDAVREAASIRKERRVAPAKGEDFRRLQIESGKVLSRPRKTSQLKRSFPNIRPAVLPYYVGTDICHVPRIEKVLYSDSTSPHSKPKGKKFSSPNVNHRFLERLFNEYELDYVKRTRLLNLTECQKQHFTNFVAGRWAAKEAIIKSAPPDRRLTLQDVMVIKFSKTEAEKPRGIILTTKCAKEFEAIRKRNRACLAETLSSTIDSTEQKLDCHLANKDIVETDTKIRVGSHDIEGQEVRLSISHDGVYATAVAISPLEHLKTVRADQKNDARSALKPTETEIDDDISENPQ